MPPRITPFAVLLALTIACSGDDESSAPTATLFPELAASPGATSVPPPVPTPCTDDGGLIVPCNDGAPSSIAWLIDVRDGSATQIFEAPYDDAIRYAGFDGDQTVLGIRNPDTEESLLEVDRYELDGSAASVEPWATVGLDATASAYRWLASWLPGDPLCQRVDGGIELDGEFYTDVDCGVISPDGRWMVYDVPRGEIVVDPPGWTLPSWDQWALDLETGERSELRAGLAQCNADSIFGPTWSQSSRYVFLADCSITSGRIILADVVELTSRVLLEDTPSYRNMPDWSASRDLIVYPDGHGGTTLEDLNEGLTVDLGLPWPARFDTTGRYVYAASPGSDEANPETVIYDTETFVSTTLPGEALYDPWPVRHTSVAGRDGGYVAALPDPLYCAGMQIYVDGTPLVCIDGGEAPSFSPDGKYVALTAGSDVVVVDIETGEQHVVAEGVRSNIRYPIPAPWNDAGTHIIVRSPYEYGPIGP